MLAKNEHDAEATEVRSLQNQIPTIISMTKYSSHRGAARRFAAVAFLAFAFVQAAPAEIEIKSGEKIAFLGDSITEGGWGNPRGYVRLVMAGLEANGVKADAVPAGISGHKSDNMLA